MAKRTKVEFVNYILNNIKPNGNNEITAQIEQNLFLDFVDSFVITSSDVVGTINVSQTSKNITPVGSNTTIPFITTPKYGVSVNVNGQTFEVGNLDTDDFFVLSPTTTNRDLGQIVVNDILHYNSGNIGFLIDSTDIITLNYLVQI